MEVKNARIESTTLGMEDHGIFTVILMLDFGGSSQGFGGYRLDAPGNKGTAFGMEFIVQTLRAVGCDNWEDLPDKHVRVRYDGGQVVAIGHIIEDKWFVPSDLAAQHKAK